MSTEWLLQPSCARKGRSVNGQGCQACLRPPRVMELSRNIDDFGKDEGEIVAEGMETQDGYAVSLLTVAIRLQATRQASCVRERDLLDDRIALFVSKGSSCAHVSSGSQRECR